MRLHSYTRWAEKLTFILQAQPSIGTEFQEMRKRLHNPLEDFYESTAKANEDKIKKNKKIKSSEQFRIHRL